MHSRAEQPGQGSGDQQVVEVAAHVLLHPLPLVLVEHRAAPFLQHAPGAGVDDDEALVLGAHDGDPVRPVVDAQEDRRLLAQVLDEELAGLLGVAAPLEDEIALELAGGAGQADLVGGSYGDELV